MGRIFQSCTTPRVAWKALFFYLLWDKGGRDVKLNTNLRLMLILIILGTILTTSFNKSPWYFDYLNIEINLPFCYFEHLAPNSDCSNDLRRAKTLSVLDCNISGELLQNYNEVLYLLL
jgi:hypothetical protein